MVTVGVDAHTDVHVAAVLDQAGRLLEIASFPATTRGYAQLATWAESFGPVDEVGMEGTGSFGAGLLRFLADYGLAVIEVDRPDRQGRRRRTAWATSPPAPPASSPPPCATSWTASSDSTA